MNVNFVCIIGMVFSCFVAGGGFLGRKLKKEECMRIYERMKSGVVDLALNGILAQQENQAAGVACE